MRLTASSTKEAWVKFVGVRAFTHAVTLKPNHRTEKATAHFLRSAFIRFHRDVDQFLLGPRFHEPSKRHLRTEAVGIMEGMPFAGHIHSVFRVAPDRWTDFESLFRPMTADITTNPKWLNPWAFRIVGGTSVAERLYDTDGWVSYSTKHFMDRDAADRIVFLPSDA